MSRRVVLPALLLLLALVLGMPAATLAAPPRADRDGDGVFEDLEAEMREGRADRAVDVIVVMDRAATATRVGDLEAAVTTLDSTQRYRVIDAFAASVDQGDVRKLSRQPGVEHVELDAPVHAYDASAQESFGVTAARTAVPGLDGDGDGLATYSADDLVAAVIDTGIDAGHVSLDGGKVIAFQDFTEATFDADLDLPYDNNPAGHGTHVSGTIAGDGEGAVDGATGVAPGAALVGLKVLDANGNGFSSDVIAAIQWATTHRATYGIEAVNLSLGGEGCSDGTDAEADAVDAAVAAGLVVVVAAGNEGPGRCTISSPGATESAITVGAMADVGVGGFFMADFSSRGKTLDGRIKPDIVAPGVLIDSAAAGTTNDYKPLSGTSMASPFVAGVALLLRDHNPSLTPAQVKTALRATAVDWGRGGDEKQAGTSGEDIDHGAGRLDAHAALASVGAAVGAAPAVPGHQLVEGSLAGTDASNNFELTSAGGAFPLAVTITVAADDQNGDGFSDPGSNGCHAVDFDAVLTDSDGVPVPIYTRSGAEDTDGADGCWRSDVLWLPAGPATTYTLTIRSWSGGGGYFLDVSGGTAVALGASPTSGTPTISGDTQDGGVLTASPGTWSGADPMNFAPQWLRCDAGGSSCATVSGATANTYTLGSADIGSTMRVRVTASNAAGDGNGTSAATSVIAAAGPRSSSLPTIAGTALQGQTLTGTDGSWVGTAPIALARQWLRCDAAGSACVAIPAATGSTYDLVADDVGRRLRLRVTATNSGGSTAAQSEPSAVVQAVEKPAPAPAPAPAPSDDDTTTPITDDARPRITLTRTNPLGAVRIRITCASKCAATGRLTAPKWMRSLLGGSRLLASGKASLPAGRNVVRLNVRKAKLARLRRAGLKRATAVLRLTVTDADGQVRRLTRKVRVRMRR